MSDTVFDRLHQRLSEAQASFEVIHHVPVYTSEEAAAVRGESLSAGAKALIVKVDDRFVMFVMPADRKLEGKRVKQALRVKSVRFATREEVETLTGLQPGSIPPFGSLFQLVTYVDPALGLNERIFFNAGDHSISIALPHEEYLRVEQPIAVVVTGS